MLLQEWKQLFKNKMLMIVLIAIVAIPTIYTTLFLGSMWDPYGKLENLPVAIVNKDQPVNYEDTTLKVGEELIDNLKDNDELDFHFVDSKEAEEGLENGDYYMVITIPEDFSECASTLMDDNPQKMQLNYSTNPGSNYIASKMSETAFARIKNEVANEVTKTYTDTVFEQLVEIADGMQDGADGAGEIVDGVEKLQNGNNIIKENLEVLADSSLTFKDGSEELSVGLKSYTDGVSQVAVGTVNLKNGTQQLASGSNTLRGGTKTLNTGILTLASGTQTLDKSTSSLTSGVSTLLTGANTLSAGAGSLYTGTTSYVQGTNALADGVKSYIGGVNQLASGANQLSGLTNLATVSSGISQLNTAVSKGTDENPSLVDATSQLSSGLVTIKQQVDSASNTLDAQNLQKLQIGLSQAATGISSAAGGMNTAADTMSQVSTALTSASTALTTGVSAMNQQVAANNQKIGAVADLVNSQIDKANKSIDSQGEQAKNTINKQVDAAIAAIDASVESGAITEETADVLRTNLESTKVTESITGNVEKISKDDLSLSEVAMPQKVEDSVLQVSSGLDSAASGLSEGASTLTSGAESLTTLIGAIPSSVNTDTFAVLSQALDTAVKGAQKIETGTKQVSIALDNLETGTSSFPAAAMGMQSLLNGFSTLTANNEMLTSGAQTLIDSGTTLTSGAKQVSDGAAALVDGGAVLGSGATKLAEGIKKVNTGTLKLKAGSKSLLDGVITLDDGIRTLDRGATELVTGTGTLVSNNATLLNGSSQLSDGAARISDGAEKLADGSGELSDGLLELSDGSSELEDALANGAKEVRDSKAGDSSIDMFADPIEDTETKITNMPNNGHAMSAYMMSVALWVGCLAFCLMYPLTAYKGELKSGFAWWVSKATVLGIISAAMAVVMIGMLHICNGFHPASYSKTILVAVLAAIAFMSIMYFFDVLFGKVGSFLMLVFMVVQLAGSAGTYPVEISGDFVSKIHDYLPFTYTVNAFRFSIAGGGSIKSAVEMLISITIIFSILTLVMFIVKAFKIKNNRPMLEDFLEEKGLL